MSDAEAPEAASQGVPFAPLSIDAPDLSKGFKLLEEAEV